MSSDATGNYPHTLTPESRRSQPEHVARLLELATEALKSPDFAEHDSKLQPLGEYIDNLDMRDLDNGRYYLLSLAARNLYGEFQDPVVREAVIDRGATAIAETVGRGSGAGFKGIQGAAEQSTYENGVFDDEAQRAYIALSPEERLVGDFLATARQHRQGVAPRPDLSEEAEREKTIQEQIDMLRQQDLDGDYKPELLSQLKDSAFTGAGILSVRVLAAHETSELGVPGDPSKSPILKKHVLPSKKHIKALRHPSVARIAQRAAALRIADLVIQEDFNFIMLTLPTPPLFSVEDHDGKLAWARPSELVRSDQVLHGGDYGWRGEGYYIRKQGKGLVCPAATVSIKSPEQTIGMFSDTLSMVADMIERAVEVIERRRIENPEPEPEKNHGLRWW